MAAPRVVEHACLFGIYHGRLDYFYGKYLDLTSAGQLDALARSPRLPLEIVAKPAGKSLELRVMWKGELLPKHRFGVIAPDGEEIDLAPNDAGVVTFEPNKPGVYGFWAIRMDDEVSGTHEGEKYRGTVHSTTVSIKWPLGK